MTIPFSQISSSRRIPLFVAEIGRGEGTPPDFVNPSVVLGQMNTSGGTATAGTRYRVTSSGQAATLFGRGSPAHLMCAAFLRQHPTGQLYAIALGDAVGATAGSQTITFTGPSTAAGTIFLYIAGQIVEVAVASGVAATAIATAVVAAITALTDLPVTAAVGGSGSEHIVTVTSKFKGTVANLVTVAINPLGQAGDQVLPAGVGATLGAATLASGATDPTSSSWVTALGDDPYDVIAFQDTTSGPLGVLKTEMARRWNANSALDGMVFAACADALADLETLADGRQDEHLTIAGYKEASGWLTPAFELAAAYAGVAARELGNDPAANLQLLPLVGVWGGGTNFTDTERNSLASAGIATVVARGGNALLEFEATTRSENEFGEPDRTWEEIQVAFILSRLRRRLRFRIESRYPAHKLADDGSPIKSGQKIVTPQILKGELLAEYASCADDGLVEGSPENIAAFKADLIVERDESNPSRVSASISPDLINRFRVFATLINFKS